VSATILQVDQGVFGHLYSVLVIGSQSSLQRRSARSSSRTICLKAERSSAI
jgi:hypothetical protein